MAMSNLGNEERSAYLREIRSRDELLLEWTQTANKHLEETVELEKQLAEKWQPIRTPPPPEGKRVEFYNWENGIPDRWIGVLNIVDNKYIYGEPVFCDGWNACDPTLEHYEHNTPTHWRHLVTGPHHRKPLPAPPQEKS